MYFFRFYLIFSGDSFLFIEQSTKFFLNSSLFENAFIFSVVIVAFFFFHRWLSLCDGSMCTRCDNIQVFEHWNEFCRDAILKWSAHFIMNCWWSSNGCSWHQKFVSWTLARQQRRCFYECVSTQASKKWSAFRRQCETLWSAPIKTFGINLWKFIQSNHRARWYQFIQNAINSYVQIWWAFQIHIYRFTQELSTFHFWPNCWGWFRLILSVGQDFCDEWIWHKVLSKNT